MQKLDAVQRVWLAAAAISALKALETTDSTLTHFEFARAIGLVGENDPWQAWHRTQISDVLNLASAADRQANGGEETLPFYRVVNAQTDETGVGIDHHSAI
jgi:hypothetical protein